MKRVCTFQEVDLVSISKSCSFLVHHAFAYKDGQSRTAYIDQPNSSPTKVAFKCHHNFHFVSGDKIHFCRNGTWVGQEYICEVDYMKERFRLSSIIVILTMFVSFIFLFIDFYYFHQRRKRTRAERSRRLFMAAIQIQKHSNFRALPFAKVKPTSTLADAKTFSEMSTSIHTAGTTASSPSTNPSAPQSKTKFTKTGLLARLRGSRVDSRAIYVTDEEVIGLGRPMPDLPKKKEKTAPPKRDRFQGMIFSRFKTHTYRPSEELEKIEPSNIITRQHKHRTWFSRHFPENN